MNLKEFRILQSLDIPDPLVSAEDFEGDDRTLLYGYTVARYTWHVYLRRGKIHRMIYTHKEQILDYQARPSWGAAQLIPNKRVYPESTDYGLAVRLKRLELDVAYLPFDPVRYERVAQCTFHGKIYD